MTKPIKWIPYRPSNGTEGGIFEEQFCDQCVKDREQDCPIHTAVMVYDELDAKYPKEWVIPENTTSWPGEAKCTAFQPYAKEVPW